MLCPDTVGFIGMALSIDTSSDERHFIVGCADHAGETNIYIYLCMHVCVYLNT